MPLLPLPPTPPHDGSHGLAVAFSCGGDSDSDGNGGGDGDGPPEEADPPVAVKAWLGPAGTVSCLHFDRPHNLLCQAVGWKRVLLVDPREPPCRLYPHGGGMGNTSQVDPEAARRAPPPRGAPAVADGRAAMAAAAAADGDPFPQFAAVRLYYAVLGPGDALYIPPRWWHHVRALSASFSVSWWWGGPRGA